MRFERVRLENFKCYDDADLNLDAGVTVIHGLNGSGKSSLLEACFFALYGSRALDTTLGEVVTIGAEETTVELWFTHGGGSYHVERRVRATGERAKTASCVLETPDGTYEGATDVRAYVTDLLRMDAEAFVNCAYVRQGEVNKLINASPSDRQDMLDDLLQLGKLEEYRERASDARLGVKHVLDNREGELEGLDEQVETKEDKELHATLNDLESELADLDADVERYEENRDNAVETRDEAASILEEYEQKRDRLDTLESEIADLEATIRETESEREDLDERIRELKTEADDQRERQADLLTETDLEDPDAAAVEERIEAVEADLEDVRERIEAHRLAKQRHEDEAAGHREDAADLADRAEQKRERVADMEDDLAETRATLADRREKLETLADRIAEAEAVFEDAPVDPAGAGEHCNEVMGDLNDRRARETKLETTLENEREALGEAEALLEAGKCPECGQPVADSPHVETIDDQRERIADLEDELVSVRAERERLEEELDAATDLADAATDLEQYRNNRENVAQLVAEKEESIEQRDRQLTDLRETAAELESNAEARREAAAEAAAEAEAEREAIAECNRDQQQLREQLDRLESVRETFTRVADIEADVERLREQRADKAELNDERRERLADTRDRRDELAAEFDDSAVEQARTERDRAEKYLQKVEPKLEELRAEREELTARIGGVRAELAELETLRERRDELAATVEDLRSLYEEASQLQEMYGTLRAELRQRNVESLERMLNETFELVYQNDSYSRIELDGEYELTVFQKDGEPLDPEQLSGGERALFNLSLRCAIYRLLAEGIEGAAPMPPLILDEPTVFLDSGHVSQLVELVASMRDLGVDQILVVSHDEELVGAADDLVMVEKNATTNRSSVRREDADPAVLAALD